MSYTTYCIARVWDNGDMRTCTARPTVGTTSLCKSCLKEETTELRKKIKELTEEKKKLTNRLQRLQIGARKK